MIDEENSQLNQSSVSYSYYGTEQDTDETTANPFNDLKLQQLQFDIQQQQELTAVDFIDSARSTELSSTKQDELKSVEEKKDQSCYYAIDETIQDSQTVTKITEKVLLTQSEHLQLEKIESSTFKDQSIVVEN